MDGLAECSQDVVPLSRFGLCSPRLVCTSVYPVAVVCCLHVFGGPYGGSITPVFAAYPCRFNQPVGAQNLVGRNRDFRMLRQGIQWLLTSPEQRAGIPRRTFISWSGQAVAGVFAGLLCLRHDPWTLRIPCAAP